jgi:hypothetical protein
VEAAPFDFDDFKPELDTLFFTDRDVIKKGTPMYDEFWKFFYKYQVNNNSLNIKIIKHKNYFDNLICRLCKKNKALPGCHQNPQAVILLEYHQHFIAILF